MLQLHLHLMEASACRRPETTWLSCNTKLRKLLSLLLFLLGPSSTASFAASCHILWKMTRYNHFHLHISTSPRPLFFLTAQLWSHLSDLSDLSPAALPWTQRCCSYTIYDTSIYVYIIFHLLYILHHITYKLYNITQHTSTCTDALPISSYTMWIPNHQDRNSRRRIDKKWQESHKNHRII